MEIPTKIRYDFLLILLGVGFLIARFYLSIGEEDPLLSTVLILLGAISLIYWLEYAKEDYYIEMDLKELEYIKKKYELTQILKVRGLINEEKEKEIFGRLKKNLNKK